MNKITIFLIIISFVVLGGGAYIFTKPTVIPEVTGYEYFWGNGCPHCEIVDEFFENWEGKDKIKINKMEIWSNTKNAELMTERATKCGISRSNMGVPLLVIPDGTCLVGDQQIIEHYKSLTF